MDIRSTAWQKFRAGLLADAAEADQPCWICRRPIDYTLDGRHPAGPTLDHLVPRAFGGQLLDAGNCAVAHKSCNSSRGARQRNAVINPSSRRW